MLESKSIDFTDVLGDFMIEFLMVCEVKILLLESCFRLSSIEALFFNGLIGFLGGIVVIFSVVRIGEMA